MKKVTIGCGGMSRENVTVFESKGDEQVRRKINLFYVGNNIFFIKKIYNRREDAWPPFARSTTTSAKSGWYKK